MYIEEGYTIKHDFWRYILGWFLIFMGWQLVGMIPLMVAIISKVEGLADLPTDITEMSDLLGSNTFLFLMLLAFAIAMATTFLTAKLLHGQGIVSLTTSRKKIDWRRIRYSFGLWAGVSIVLTLIDVFLSPEDYILNFELMHFLILAVIAVTLIPFQTSFEEYFLRGYSMQGIGLLAKNRWVPLLITSVIFGLLHLANPEVGKLGYGIMIYYIGTGLFLGVLTLMDEGLELALGFHAANNLTGALLLTSDWSAFQTHSIYKDISDPVLGWDVLAPVLIVYPILLFIFAKKYGWSDWKGRLTGSLTPPETIAPLEMANPNLNNETNDLS
ncbi:MAG: CPBP family intramembrane glutamic endopeptidase [Flavobacteriaceae bacterium]